MQKPFQLTAEQASKILDHAPVAVYVSSVDDRSVLYANNLIKEIFLKDVDCDAFCCYHAAGFSQPCPFCHKKEMNDADFLVREYQHPVNGRIYELSGKLIDWDGRPAHIEYIADITEKKTILDKGIMPSEKVLDFPVDCNTLTGSVNL